METCPIQTLQRKQQQWKDIGSFQRLQRAVGELNSVLGRARDPAQVHGDGKQKHLWGDFKADWGAS